MINQRNCGSCGMELSMDVIITKSFEEDEQPSMRKEAALEDRLCIKVTRKMLLMLRVRKLRDYMK